MVHTMINCVTEDKVTGGALTTTTAGRTLILLDAALIAMYLYYAMLIVVPDKDENMIFTGLNVYY